MNIVIVNRSISNFRFLFRYHIKFKVFELFGRQMELILSLELNFFSIKWKTITLKKFIGRPFVSHFIYYGRLGYTIGNYLKALS